MPLVEALVELSERFTVLASVPNDAFWALENPYHHTRWGEGAFAELRTLLPEGHVVAHQISLHGSAAIPVDGGAVDLDPRTRAGADGVPTHFLVAFGPAASRIGPCSALTQTDLDERRRWERQRESDLAFFRAANARLQAQVDEQRAELREIIAERDDFRRYIHDLEGRLGLPLSGGGEQQEPAALPPA